MRVKTVPSEWILREGRRMDCNPYMSGALETKILLEELSLEKMSLQTLTGGMNGLINAGRIKRIWVDSEEHGHRFLSSTDILQADLSRLRCISQRAVRENPKLTIRQGWTLITRAGTIGRMAYAREDMDGMACTEDVLRVIPDKNSVPSGYLYAYLSSKFGVPLVVSGTYGAIIQHIEPHHIADLPVPRLGDAVEQRAHELVEEAARKRTEAAEGLAAALRDVEEQVGAPAPVELRDDPRTLGHSVSISEIAQASRLEGFFHNPIARKVDHWVANHDAGFWLLGDIATIFDVPPFKHIYVGADYGVPFYTSGELFRLERKAHKHLSRKRTKGLEKYILERGWVLLARSGQLGGIIGRPQFSDSAMHGSSTSDHVIRIVPKEGVVPAGYLYAYLTTSAIGYPLITRTMTGASIPALWPKYLRKVKVVRAPDTFMADIDRRVQAAFENRISATAKEEEARALVERTIEEAS